MFSTDGTCPPQLVVLILLTKLHTYILSVNKRLINNVSTIPDFFSRISFVLFFFEVKVSIQNKNADITVYL